MKTQPPVVLWRSPDEVPPVEKFGMGLFWVAVQSQRKPTDKPKHSVFLAYFMNKPLELDSDGESNDPDPHVDCDGEYVEAIGWHSQYEHYEFSSGFYEPITFCEQYLLLGWAEYEPPVWSGELPV